MCVSVCLIYNSGVTVYICICVCVCACNSDPKDANRSEWDEP